MLYFDIVIISRDLLDGVIFQDSDRRNADFRTFVWRCDSFPQQTVSFAELKKYPETKEPDTLITFGNTQNQEIRPQGLDLGGSTASNEANLRG